MPARSFRGPLRIADIDGNPEGTPISLEFTSGSVTDNGNGVYSVDVTYGSTPPSIGGSITSATPGSVLFVGGTASAPVFAQDNQNFCFDDTNDSLKIRHTLGSEKVSNGTFSGSASGWTVGSGWAYSSNTVVHSSNGTAVLSQNVSAVVGEEYVLTYTISGWTVGTCTPALGGVTGTAVSANGTYSERITATSTGVLQFTPSNTARFTIDNVSVKRLSGGSVKTGELDIWQSASNGTPGTTRHILLDNNGSYTWIENRFNGTLKSAIGADASGGLNIYTNGSSGLALYYSTSLYSYNYSSGFVHYGFGYFGGNVSAGGYSATSTLQTYGGLSAAVTRKTAAFNFDNTATHWLMDGTTAAACSGTPSNSCGSWLNEADCIKWDAHGGCSWNPGSDCSAFNYESGMTTCSGTSGCTVTTASCAGPTDQYNCESQDDSYGGSCTWNTYDCSGLDEATCGITSGCSQNYSDCSSFNGDQTTCEATAGCTWSDPDCTGTYYSGCSGSYGDCSGDYYTGGCTGTFGSGCIGTSTCTGIDDSTNCGNETGCTWISVLNGTLPDGETCPGRTYWIKNDASGGADAVILPYSGQTIEKTTSLTLANYQDGVGITYYKQTGDCSVYNADEATCSSTSGCTPQYGTCATYYGTDMTTCQSHGSCVWSDPNCDGADFFTGCSGTYAVSKNWYVIGRT